MHLNYTPVGEEGQAVSSVDFGGYVYLLWYYDSLLCLFISGVLMSIGANQRLPYTLPNASAKSGKQSIYLKVISKGGQDCCVAISHASRTGTQCHLSKPWKSLRGLSKCPSIICSTKTKSHLT